MRIGNAPPSEPPQPPAPAQEKPPARDLEPAASSSSSSLPSSSSTSTATTTTSSSDTAVQWPAWLDHIPKNMFVFTGNAAFLGFLVGARRGARKAQLRYLAENAHRQPRTVQGWYYYHKTRNYRMIWGGLLEGGRYATRLSGAVMLFVAADETAGNVRERLWPATKERGYAPPESRWGWREGPVHVGDGAVAGATLATVMGVSNRLPGPVLVRAIGLGIVGGAVTSGLMMLSDKLAGEAEEAKQQKEAEEAAAAAARGDDPDAPKPEEEMGWIGRVDAWIQDKAKEKREEEKANKS